DFRRAWGPAVTLATLGVVLTAIVTGVVAWRLLGLSLLEGILLGSIVGSTDAAAVFAIFRSRGVHVDERLTSTLEVESGSNDPMAVFLTVALLEVLVRGADPSAEFAWLLARQMVIGAAVGAAVGYAGAWVLIRIRLDSAGLYPVLTGALALTAYGIAADLGGSGFLSVYLAGIVLGNSQIVFRRGILLFHDGVAWTAQIVMFVVLGMLSMPSRLADVAGPGLVVAAALIFVARPLAVIMSLLPFRFSWRQVTFASWVGLRGSVPIVLAIYPLMFGLPNAVLLFDVVFFVVLVSALLQGWTLAPVGRLLGVDRPRPPEPPLSLEITSLHDVDGVIVEYRVDEGAHACERRIRDLALPDGVVIGLVARSERLVAPHGSTRLEAGDYVFVIMNPAMRPLVDRVFATEDQAEPPPPEFPLRGRTTLDDLKEFYGIEIEDESPTMTLDGIFRDRLGEVREGDALEFGDLVIVAREVVEGKVETVGLSIAPRPD
ncbi:MAG TPA: potassium/proton antiporter, partial [Gemmatimonadota bacterium]|nr:potassium/proton antiporter [Gemmatimonadota bacterium]